MNSPSELKRPSGAIGASEIDFSHLNDDRHRNLSPKFGSCEPIQKTFLSPSSSFVIERAEENY